MAVPTSSQVLSLYRRMLKESKKFTTYNYRTFALRRIKDAFRENKNVTNPDVIQQLIETANANLEIIRRQQVQPTGRKVLSPSKVGTESCAVDQFTRNRAHCYSQTQAYFGRICRLILKLFGHVTN
ncbi:LYR motif-containing protein 4-like isoform X1 [Chiloscyllium plagiosum]|uniref:LYR motif-containing protein 4-like isoform X1 n=1 Tax=Chiloscyllium plagiosum TaxID=36176 RepID=UPI001CB7DF94|nr:LYR motif-containing protein 4-like isoform X1 [Chiloscyllium plagiosum]